MPEQALTWRQMALLLATSASFASSVILNKLMVNALPPLTLAASRVLLALPFCVVAMVLMRRSLPREPRDRTAVALASLGIITVPYTALAIGQQTIASGLSGILYSIIPLLTLLLGAVFLRDERLGLARFAGIATGMAGVVVVIGPSVLGGLGEHAVAELITLCGPIAYASAMVLMRRFRHIDPVSLTTGAFVAASTVLVPLAFIFERPLDSRPDVGSLLTLLALATVGTLMPAVLNYLLVRQVGATRAAIAMFLMPVVAVLGGWSFLDERLGIHAFAGLALILLGSFLVNGRFGRAGAASLPAPSAAIRATD
ncbi:MAG: DMT family transporter [Betaproteobacteria bacterium]|nr:DMT family transporter [Betaproteobacteria bacterium]